MKRIAGLSLTIASLLIMNSPADAVPLGNIGRRVLEGVEDAAPATDNLVPAADNVVPAPRSAFGETAETLQPYVETLAEEGAMQLAESEPDFISEPEPSGVSSVLGIVVFAAIIYGVYRVVRK